MCIDPWGQVQAQQAQGPGVVLGTLERPRMQAWREQLPAREHRIL
jgi:nitrilase